MSPPPDVLVVGGGVVGAACAYYLSLDGLRPLLLEAGFVGGGTTAAAMGHIVVMDDSEPQLALTAYSRGLLDELRPALDGRTEFDPAGTLWLAEDPAQLELVRSKHAFYAAHGIAAEILDEGDVARLEPRLRTPLAGALRVPGDHIVYPPGFAHWLAQQAVRRGATIQEHTRVDAIHERGVTAGGRRIDAGAVVNAAGNAAPSLAPGLPVVPRKGHLVITERYPGFCRHELVELGYLQSAHGVSTESVAFNVQPRPTGQLLIGSSRELVGPDTRINRDILRRMLRRAIAFLPGLAGLTAIRAWTGLRPATPDRLPLIGQWGDSDGHWVAAGHEGLGITMALGTGRIISDLIAGRAPAIGAAPFSPARLALAGGA
jgi:D-hydroxyproline dehydrogenase subunit beta